MISYSAEADYANNGYAMFMCLRNLTETVIDKSKTFNLTTNIYIVF